MRVRDLFKALLFVLAAFFSAPPPVYAATQAELKTACEDRHDAEACFNLGLSYTDWHNRVYNQSNGTFIARYQPDYHAREAFVLACRYGYKLGACEAVAEELLRGELAYNPQAGLAALQRECDLSQIKPCRNLTERLQKARKGCPDPVHPDSYYACGQMGEFYYTGVLVERDPTKARSYFEGACGHVQYFCVPLAELLLQGRGGPADQARGMTLLESACRNFTPADICADAARIKHILQPDRAGAWSANVLASKGCNTFSGESCRILAVAEMEGWGQTSNFDDARRHAQRACDLGSVEGCRMRLAPPLTLDDDVRSGSGRYWTNRLCLLEPADSRCH
mgnify:FL=1